MSKEYLFTQSITHNDEEIDPDLKKSVTLTYRVNSLAPILILKLLNVHNFILEDLGMKKGDELKVRFMAYYDEDDQGRVMTFVILDIKQDKNRNILIIECLEESAYRLSQKDYVIFSNETISSILKTLLPKLRVECGRFQAENTYHLPNRRRFEVLSQMAKENGAVFFITPGKITFKTKDELFNQGDIAEYEYKNKSAVYQITAPRLFNQDFVNDELKRCFIGWNMEKGLIQSAVDTGYPLQMHCCDTAGKLNNLNQKLTQAVTFKALGEGSLLPGSPIKTIWHSGISERPIDESYPERVLLSEVIHHEGKDFHTTIVGAV